ncbi:hypothetical protein METH109765_17800 [Mesobacillus thioparans]
MIYQYVENQVTKGAYWLRDLPVCGDSYHQCGLLVAHFSSMWRFVAPMELIGDMFHHYMENRVPNEAFGAAVADMT